MKKSTIDNITIKNACEHNLKGISCYIPKNSITVISGPSGAGKTSLAVDTILKENNFRLRALLSMQGNLKEKVSYNHLNETIIEGLPPTFYRKERYFLKFHTVASLTNFDQDICRLFQQYGKRVCPHCKKGEITAKNSHNVADEISNQQNKYTAICAKIKNSALDQNEAFKAFEKCLMKTSSRIVFNEKIYDLDDDEKLKQKIASLFVSNEIITFVIDRLAPNEAPERLKQGIELAERLQNCGVAVYPLNDVGQPITIEVQHYTENGICNNCGYTSFPLSSTNFNFKIAPKVGNHCEFADLIGVNFLTKEQQDEILDYTIFNLSLREFLYLSFLEIENLLKSEKINLEQFSTLSLLNRLGLGYLTPLRTCKTLSNGELQRVQLIPTLRNNMEGVLLILDEPTLGLHPLNIIPLAELFDEIRLRGTTLLLVENNQSIIKEAQHQICLGPSSGRAGGELIYQGAPKIIKQKDEIKLNTRHKFSLDNSIQLFGVNKNNLKNVSVKIPFHALTCISGVSGSGKSSLIFETLLPALKKIVSLPDRGFLTEPIVLDNQEDFEQLVLTEKIDRVVAAPLVPEVITYKSFIASYIGLFSHLKFLFSQMPLAKINGLSAESFSPFKNGCVACNGTGVEYIDSNTTDICPKCFGKRFNEDVTKIHFKGYSISNLLEMSAEEALPILSFMPYCKNALELLIKFHLAYLPLGQALNSVSYGELQRLKFVKEFCRSNKQAVYLFDEPASGLASDEVNNIVAIFKELISAGNTIIAIEHNNQFLSSADYIIDLGKVGGVDGGKTVISGSYEDVKNNLFSALSYSEDC